MLSTFDTECPSALDFQSSLGLEAIPIPRPVPSPPCSICYKPVPLETCKTDEAGKAVHEECYALKLKQIGTPEQWIWRREA
jgi:hypothetical protein